MPNYVDVYVLAVPRARLDDYRKLASTAGAVWKEYGAIDYIEIIEEDVKTWCAHVVPAGSTAQG